MWQEPGDISTGPVYEQKDKQHDACEIGLKGSGDRVEVYDDAKALHHVQSTEDGSDQSNELSMISLGFRLVDEDAQRYQ